MPLYEYRCRACDGEFEALVTASRPAACPSCGGADLDKLLSVVARPATGAHEPFAAPAGCGRCGDPRGPGACQLD